MRANWPGAGKTTPDAGLLIPPARVQGPARVGACQPGGVFSSA